MRAFAYIEINLGQPDDNAHDSHDPHTIWKSTGRAQVHYLDKVLWSIICSVQLFDVPDLYTVPTSLYPTR